MSAINRGHENSCVRYSDYHNTRACTHRFYTSVIMCDSNDGYELKIGAALSVHLTKNSIENESCKEESSLSRTLGSPEDLQCVCNYEMSNDTSKNAMILSMITTARESRNNKRNYEMFQDKEAKKVASIEHDTTHDLKSFHESFHKSCSASEMLYFLKNGVIKSRRQLKTTCDLHASAQEITTCEDLNTKCL